MKIIADENIPLVEKAFASLGEVKLLPGRGMSAAQVRDADILLVRSVTPIDERLLAGSNIRFVGSATIGYDHVDRAYLEGRNIGFSTAPGSNAAAVSEYVLSALLVLAQQESFDLQAKRVGIVGCGNVGSRVRKTLSTLGVECLVNDPPLRRQGGHDDFVELDVVAQADIITVHVPLAAGGDYPTLHLCDRDFFERLKPGAIYLNTSRGAVADNHALERALAGRDDLSIVLDVWEDEPNINLSLLEKVKLATPHIAGYSLDGKLRGTDMMYRAACEYFGLRREWSPDDDLQNVSLTVATGFVDKDITGNIRNAVQACYDIRQDDERLRLMSSLPEQERSLYFDRLRREYPVRREFTAHTLARAGLDAATQKTLQGLGFILR